MTNMRKSQMLMCLLWGLTIPSHTIIAMLNYACEAREAGKAGEDYIAVFSVGAVAKMTRAIR